ncbi:hypothetical protein Trydic_g14341 [Trypoxylus dichotomus]
MYLSSSFSQRYTEHTMAHSPVYTEKERYDNVEKLTSNPGMAWGAAATSSRGSSQHSSGPGDFPSGYSRDRKIKKAKAKKNGVNEPLAVTASQLRFMPTRKITAR